MAQLQPQILMSDVSEGIIQGVAHNLCPPNSLYSAVNVVVDEEIGNAVVRKGSALLGAQIDGSNAILGGYQFISNLGVTKVLVAAVNGSLHYYNGSAWASSHSGDNSTASVEFETFLDEVVRVNGVDSPLTSTNGTSWGSSTPWDTANMPIGKFVRVYKDQVIVAGVDGDPDTLYISSVPSGGAISWTTDARTITINPEDGQNITGLGEISGLLIVFKDRAMYRWNNRATDADEVVSIGCSSQKSIVNCGTALAFFNEKGFWLTSGEQPVKISRRIQKWIDGRTSTFAVPCYGNEDYLYGSLGACTVDGESYSNIVVRYSMLSKEWVVYQYPFEVRLFTRYNDTTDKIVAGTSLSKMIWVENGSAYDDDGTDINYEMKTHEIDFGSRGILKSINERVMAYSKNPLDAIVQVQINGGDWRTLGVINKAVEQFLIKESIKGHFFRFRITGISNNRTQFKGLEFPSISTLDYSE